jgi:hypothetical protein
METRVSGVRSEVCRKIPLFQLVFAGRDPDALAMMYVLWQRGPIDKRKENDVRQPRHVELAHIAA